MGIMFDAFWSKISIQEKSSHGNVKYKIPNQKKGSCKTNLHL